jgi:polyhydroxyalkanoate synthesis regulator phasin
MKARRMIELVSLSTTLYTLSKETKLLEKLNEYAADTKNRVNAFVKNKMKNEQGEELEFTDKVQAKFNETKLEIEKKIDTALHGFYNKVNVVHRDEIKQLNEEMAKLQAELINLKGKETSVAAEKKKRS